MGWEDLISDIERNCIGLDQIAQAHEAYIHRMLQSLFISINEGETNMISSNIIRLLLCGDDLIIKCWNGPIAEYLQMRARLDKVPEHTRFQHEKNKLFRLREEAMESISSVDIKFSRLYKFCLVTIDKIKNKSLSHCAMNVTLHLDFNNFYAHSLL